MKPKESSILNLVLIIVFATGCVVQPSAVITQTADIPPMETIGNPPDQSPVIVDILKSSYVGESIQIWLEEQIEDINLVQLFDENEESLEFTFDIFGDEQGLRITINPKKTIKSGTLIKLIIHSIEKEYQIAFVTPGITLESGQVYLLPEDPESGFDYPYVLYLPPRFDPNKQEKIFLIVEGDYCGYPERSIDEQLACVMDQMIGHNNSSIATILGFPYLVPFYPITKQNESDFFLEMNRESFQIKEEKNPDRQILSMIEDAQMLFLENSIKIEDKVILVGYYGRSLLANRFALLHPDKVAAVSIGSMASAVTIPAEKFKDESLDYPAGTLQMESITGNAFDVEAYREIPQFFYMGGAADTNYHDALNYDNSMNRADREKYKNLFGENVMPQRWNNLMRVFAELGFTNIKFKTYPKMGYCVFGNDSFNEVLTDQVNFLGKNLLGDEYTASEWTFVETQGLFEIVKDASGESRLIHVENRFEAAMEKDSLNQDASSRGGDGDGLMAIPTESDVYGFTIDGRDDDWSGNVTDLIDPSGDSSCSDERTDLTNFYYFTTPEYLYFMQRVKGDLTNQTNYHFHIDTDDPPNRYFLEINQNSVSLYQKDTDRLLGNPMGMADSVIEIRIPWEMLDFSSRIIIWPVAPGDPNACDDFQEGIVITR
jgi:hypothetical protein